VRTIFLQGKLSNPGFSKALVHLLVHPQAGLQHFSSKEHSQSVVQPSICFGATKLTGTGRQ
jgi:hypothetical protein